MNKVTGIYLSFIFLLIYQLGFTQFTAIKEKKIDQRSLDKAIELAEKLMNGMKTANYYMLTEDEATAAMIKGLSDEIQKSVYERIKSENGDYDSMKFIEALQPDNNKDLTIYRFQGIFKDNESGPEIRVVMNKELKLSGFWLLPWKDEVDTP